VIEPYAFVRGVTIALGATWTVTGLVRLVRFTASWEARLAPLGLERRWMRRQVAVACLRTTVLDPVNLGLMLVLAALWMAPR
jgi:hypothetical protein